MGGGVVRHFTRADLERREVDVVSALEERFGSLERALDEERTGSYPSEDLRLFTEYHTVRFLLGR